MPCAFLLALHKHPYIWLQTALLGPMESSGAHPEDFRISALGGRNSFEAVCMQELVYFFQPQVDCTVTISLCGSRNTSEPFDTLLYVVEGLLGPTVSGKACNDDFCSQQSQLTVPPTPLAPVHCP